MSKISENLPLLLHFYFYSFFSQPNRKKLLTKDSAFRKVFSSMLLYCFIKSAHILLAQEEVSSLGDILFQSKNKQIPKRNL